MARPLVDHRSFVSNFGSKGYVDTIGRALFVGRAWWDKPIYIYMYTPYFDNMNMY